MSIPAGLVTPTELLWARPGLLVALNDGDQLFSISTRPRLRVMRSGHGFWGTAGGSFSLDSRGDMLATGSEGSDSGAGPVQVLRLGGVSTPIGDGAYANVQPSLSPDGRRVVFMKEAADGSGRSLGIWTARTDGTHMHEIESSGTCPSWSPVGNRIVYLDGLDGGLVLIPPTGGAGITLTTTVGTLCGEPPSIVWSPDGRLIAFADSTNHLSIVDVRTKRVWTVPFTRELHGFAWSPDSRQIFFSAGNTRDCRSLWRAPVRGGRTIRISRC